MRSHWLVVRPSRHAQTQGTGSKVSLSGWSSDIHIVVSVQRPDRSERPTMGVPVHILLEKPAKGRRAVTLTPPCPSRHLNDATYS